MKVPRAARWVFWGLAVLAVVVGLYLSFFFFPYPLFRHHAEYHGFSIYSDREIGPEFEAVAEDARSRVDRMGVADGEAGLRIFICNSQRLFVLLVRLAGQSNPGQALVITAAGNAFFSVEGIDAIGRRNGGRPLHSRLEGSWSAAIAHEVAHIVIGSELGSVSQRKIPPWKAEGYADFIANLAAADSDPEYDFGDRVSLVLDDTRWRPPSTSFDRRHFRWHVQVEYLCAVRGLSFEELMDAGVSEQESWSDLKTWYSTQSNRRNLN